MAVSSIWVSWVALNASTSVWLSPAVVDRTHIWIVEPLPPASDDDSSPPPHPAVKSSREPAMRLAMGRTRMTPPLEYRGLDRSCSCDRSHEGPHDAFGHLEWRRSPMFPVTWR